MRKRSAIRSAVFGLAMATASACFAGAFAVSPIRADLKPGTLSETITVTNDGTARLRVLMKLMEWTQDATGNDVYQESAELVYFPRQMDIEPGAKRLVRVGAKNTGGPVEKTFRLFIEEVPEPTSASEGSAVAFYFRFGVPVFVAPAAPKPQPDVAEPSLDKGKLILPVRNTGNAHFRVNKVLVTDGSAFSKELAGWYSLAGSSRTYTVELPADACRRAGVLSIKLEGDGVNVERKLQVDPARCG